MRNYENSDTSSFNTYRSGRENPRRENSTRSDYTNNQVHRQGSTQGTSDHFDRNSLMHHPNDYRNLYGDRGNQQNQNRPNQYRMEQNSWQDRNEDRWPKDNRQNTPLYGNHSQDRDFNRHQSGDRDFFEKAGDKFERAGDKINDTWNRWTNDDDRDNRTNYNNRNSWDNNRNNNSWDKNRNSWNNNDREQYNSQHRYSSDFGHQNSSNQGRGYDVDRYSNRRDHYNQSNQHEDEGFFDRMGRKIKDTWNDITQEERDDRNSAYRYERNHRNDDDNRSSGRVSGPPYNFGSSSRRDYEW